MLPLPEAVFGLWKPRALTKNGLIVAPAPSAISGRRPRISSIAEAVLRAAHVGIATTKAAGDVVLRQIGYLAKRDAATFRQQTQRKLGDVKTAYLQVCVGMHFRTRSLMAAPFAVAGVGSFVWAVRRGQFNDLDTPAVRILHDHDDEESEILRG
jgi:cbb3-type cytochrome oxidase maturation protein